MPLEEQGLAGSFPLPYDPHVRTAGSCFLRLNVEARAFEVADDELGSTRLVAFRIFGMVDARDADEFTGETHQFRVVDPTEYRFQQVLEPGGGPLLQRLWQPGYSLAGSPLAPMVGVTTSSTSSRLRSCRTARTATRPASRIRTARKSIPV